MGGRSERDTELGKEESGLPLNSKFISSLYRELTERVAITLTSCSISYNFKNKTTRLNYYWPQTVCEISYLNRKCYKTKPKTPGYSIFTQY